MEVVEHEGDVAGLGERVHEPRQHDLAHRRGDRQRRERLAVQRRAGAAERLHDVRPEDDVVVVALVQRDPCHRPRRGLLLAPRGEERRLAEAGRAGDERQRAALAQARGQPLARDRLRGHERRVQLGDEEDRLLGTHCGLIHAGLSLTGARRMRHDVGVRFVIQQHQARSLHFDLRLEAGGVLKSWAVPKGPSTDPAEKRLAVQVGDHSLAHGDFEGRAGAGAVIIWDAGTYRSLTDGPVEDAIDAGHLSFWLEGEKLRGGWTLQRTSGGAKPQWLLVKRRDDAADAGDPVATRPESVVSGRTIETVE